MRMIVLLILSLGAFGAIYGSKCIPETMVCHPYRVKMEPHKNLMESEEELNSWCRQQFLFFSCLEDVLLGKYGNYSELPTNILVSKMFSEDLCLEGSPNRKRYLDNAACINQLDLEYCKLPEYLDIIIPGGSAPPSKCSNINSNLDCLIAFAERCPKSPERIFLNYMKETKKLSTRLCSKMDEFRSEFLKNVPCLNKHVSRLYENCRPSYSSKVGEACKERDAILKCVAERVSENCGFESRRVFNTLHKPILAMKEIFCPKAVA